MQNFQGKIIVITGAARGIGRATAIAFAQAGADCIVGIDACKLVCPSCGVKPSTPSDLEDTGKLVKNCGADWFGVIADQRDLSTLRHIASFVERKLGGVDILFANAGVQGFVSLLEMKDDDWNTTIDVNLTGTANVIRAFAPQMVRKHRGGRIIVTSSGQGRQGTKNASAYSASKWGLIGLMKSAALELGKHKITVNAVIPGLVNTELTRHESRYAQIIDAAGETPSGEEKLDEWRARQIQMKNSPFGIPWIEAEDVVPVVLFLPSDAAKMVTGSTYDIRGGDSAHSL